MRKVALILVFVLLIGTTTVNASLINLFNRTGDVDVITYHLVSKDPAQISHYCITPDMFESDIKYLKSQGYEFMTASQLASTTNTRGRKIALLTFDDGYESDYLYVVPLLEKYNACATFFIFGGAIGKPGYLSKEQLLEMSKKSCVEIGNHSYENHNYTYNQLIELYGSGTNNQMILNDYKKNDEFIKSIIGKVPTSLSYPNGIYNTVVDAELKKTGKIITVSTEEVDFKGISPYFPVGRKNRSAFRNLTDMVR